MKTWIKSLLPFKAEEKVGISVIVNFYNMEREAERTLFSLSQKYQNKINSDQYEVIAIDNGSSVPLDPKKVAAFGRNFRYVFFDAKTPSPCEALNYGVSIAKYQNVMLCIDGARILSPSILFNSLQVCSLYDSPFAYTIGMHIGHKPQNYLLEEGYNQVVEDKLLDRVDWRNNGYELFKVSSLALSAKKGIFSSLAESNCFTLKKSDYIELGGFDEKFISKGGGISNLDIFAKIISNEKFTRVMLLGEATFHQFHGGVATNVEMENHPLASMMEEFRSIRGKDFEFVFKLPDYYFGSYSYEYHESLVIPRDEREVN